jgi:hypothetical protein
MEQRASSKYNIEPQEGSTEKVNKNGFFQIEKCFFWFKRVLD